MLLWKSFMFKVSSFKFRKLCFRPQDPRERQSLKPETLGLETNYLLARRGRNERVNTARGVARA
jgi:hypothetical protein